MKFVEMRKQVEDCKEMRLVCEHLMPPKNCKIDSNVINENLSIVGAISTRENRKMVCSHYIFYLCVEFYIITFFKSFLKFYVNKTKK